MRTHRIRGALVVAVAAIAVSLVSACTNPVVTGPRTDYFGVATLDVATGQWVGGYPGEYCGYDYTMDVRASEVVHVVVTWGDGEVFEFETDEYRGVPNTSGCMRVELSGPNPFTYEVHFVERWA